MAAGSPISQSFREVIREYYTLAQHYSEKTLQQIEILSKHLSGRYLFSLHLIYHLYKQVFDRIDIEHGSFTSEELNPTPREIRDIVLELATGWQEA